jgi:excisionase family DNA binding protein
MAEDEKMLSAADVARRFGVNPKTVTRWAKAGKLECVRTLGGHRRYRASNIEELLKETG